MLQHAARLREPISGTCEGMNFTHITALILLHYLVKVETPKMHLNTTSVFSERELTFTFAICCRPSVCRLSVVCLSVTLVHPTQAVVIFGNISTAFGTLAIR